MNKFSVICGLSLLLTISCSSNKVKEKTPEDYMHIKFIRQIGMVANGGSQ